MPSKTPRKATEQAALRHRRLEKEAIELAIATSEFTAPKFKVGQVVWVASEKQYDVIIKQSWYPMGEKQAWIAGYTISKYENKGVTHWEMGLRGLTDKEKGQ
jgi:hypothetical protein